MSTDTAWIFISAVSCLLQEWSTWNTGSQASDESHVTPTVVCMFVNMTCTCMLSSMCCRLIQLIGICLHLTWRHAFKSSVDCLINQLIVIFRSLTNNVLQIISLHVLKIQHLCTMVKIWQIYDMFEMQVDCWWWMNASICSNEMGSF